MTLSLTLTNAHDSGTPILSLVQTHAKVDGVAAVQVITADMVPDAGSWQVGADGGNTWNFDQPPGTGFGNSVWPNDLFANQALGSGPVTFTFPTTGSGKAFLPYSNIDLTSGGNPVTLSDPAAGFTDGVTEVRQTFRLTLGPNNGGTWLLTSGGGGIQTLNFDADSATIFAAFAAAGWPIDAGASSQLSTYIWEIVWTTGQSTSTPIVSTPGLTGLALCGADEVLEQFDLVAGPYTSGTYSLNDFTTGPNQTVNWNDDATTILAKFRAADWDVATVIQTDSVPTYHVSFASGQDTTLGGGTITPGENVGDYPPTVANIDLVGMAATITGTSPTMAEGTAVHLGATIVGGTAPFTYAWSVSSDGHTTSGTLSTFSFTPVTEATYTVSLSVTDKDGFHDTESTTIRTVAVPDTTHRPASGIDDPHGGFLYGEEGFWQPTNYQDPQKFAMRMLRASRPGPARRHAALPVRLSATVRISQGQARRPRAGGPAKVGAILKSLRGDMGMSIYQALQEDKFLFAEDLGLSELEALEGMR